MLKEKEFLKIYSFIFWPLLFLTLIFIYWSSFNNFFFGDDFFNFMLSRTSSLKGVINFFNPFQAPPEFPFYRPLTTQLFYWLGKNFFGLNPLGYHLVCFSFFLFLSLFLFLLANINSLKFAFETHWTVERARVAKEVLSFFKKNYPEIPDKSKIYFFDYDYCIYPPKKTEKSKELNNVLVGNKALELVYNKDLDVFFQDTTPVEKIGIKGTILIPAKLFLPD